VALKFALVAPAATRTEAGTVSRALLLETVTLEPPVRAAWFSAIVHVETALWPRLVGLQVTPETRTGPRRLMLAVFEPPPRVVVIVAVWLLVIEAAAVALKFAVLAPAATRTDAGTVSKALLLEIVTLEPPVRAAWFSVIVHVETALWPRLVGLQVTPETRTGAIRLMVALFAAPP
jgi:hypothetical protein